MDIVKVPMVQTNLGANGGLVKFGGTISPKSPWSTIPDLYISTPALVYKLFSPWTASNVWY